MKLWQGLRLPNRRLAADGFYPRRMEQEEGSRDSEMPGENDPLSTGDAGR